MGNCKQNNINCENLILKTARKGNHKGQQFFGCKDYPECTYIIPLYFDTSNMSWEEKELERAFGLFVNSNSFLLATYGALYFNLKHDAFLDYMLKTDIVHNAPNVEVGLTGAKIYDDLFRHLFIVPVKEIKRYLINNFPKTFETIKGEPFETLISKPSNIDNIIVDESEINQYRDLRTYNK